MPPNQALEATAAAPAVMKVTVNAPSLTSPKPLPSGGASAYVTRRTPGGLFAPCPA